MRPLRQTQVTARTMGADPMTPRPYGTKRHAIKVGVFTNFSFLSYGQQALFPMTMVLAGQNGCYLL